ncbi:unnamed protein product [Gulo gulo]|uniref:Uncharacterized protein n=1 Tax=Gulo gulo TaxID=48420 RepID=A0A9X9LPJ9_GULGU|nr:unnamed protein product [Gulo gulo]
MAWNPVFLMLFSHCGCRDRSQMLTQQPSLSASSETTNRLTCTLPSGLSAGSCYYTGSKRSQGAFPGICCTTTKTQITIRALGSPDTSLDPKKLQPVQDFCLSLSCS